MKQTHFTTQVSYWIMIAIFSNILILNVASIITTGKLLGLLPIFISSIVLLLIISKHEYAKIAIKTWTLIFLITASGLQLFGRFLQDVSDNFSTAKPLYYIITGSTILLGIVMLIYVNKTLKVVVVEK